MATFVRAIGFLDLVPPTSLASVSATTTYAAVDLQPYVGESNHEMGAVFLLANLTSNTVSAITGKLQANSTSLGSDGGWTDISGAVFTTVTTNGGNAQSQEIYFQTTSRYVRLVVTVTTATVTSFNPICEVFLPARIV